MASIILKPYERRREPGLVARILLGALLVFVAMVYGVMVAIFPPQLLSWPATPILIMIGLILWLLPDVGGVPYDSLQKVVVPYLALSIVWPNYVAFNLPGLPWISLARLLLFVVLAIFVWNFSTSREMRDSLRDAVSETKLPIKLFWAFWLTTTISIVFSNDIGFSINKYLNNQIYWTMGLFVSALLATRPGFVARLIRAFMIGTGIVLVYSVFEYHNQRVIWLDHLPAFLKIDPDLLEILMHTQVRMYGADLYRVRGPYAAALYFSEFLTMAYPFFLHMTVKERRGWHFLALLAGTLGCIVVMVMTDARSAMVGLLVATFVYMFYAAYRTRTLSERSILGNAIFLAYPVILGVVALAVWFVPRFHLKVLGGAQHQGSSDARDQQWALAWPKIMQYPLGHGVGKGNDAVGWVNRGGKGSVDSYFITVMMDSGYLALPLFLLTFLVPAWLALRYYRNATTDEQQLLAPLSIALINFSIVKSVLSSEASVPLAFVFVGCICGLIWQRKRLDAPAAAATAPVAPRVPPRSWQGQPALALSPAALSNRSVIPS